MGCKCNGRVTSNGILGNYSDILANTAIFGGKYGCILVKLGQIQWYLGANTVVVEKIFAENTVVPWYFGLVH